MVNNATEKRWHSSTTPHHPLPSVLLHSALTGRDSKTVCTAALLFIFLLCPSAGHTYSFKISVCAFVGMCMYMCNRCGKYPSTKMHNLHSSTLVKTIMSWYHQLKLGLWQQTPNRQIKEAGDKALLKSHAQNKHNALPSMYSSRTQCSI